MISKYFQRLIMGIQFIKLKTNRSSEVKLFTNGITYLVMAWEAKKDVPPMMYGHKKRASHLRRSFVNKYGSYLLSRDMQYHRP